VNTGQITWLLYLVGSVLVFCSWVDLVSPGLGWIGWLMALVGWGAGSRQNRAESSHTSPSRAAQIEQLDALRLRAVITDEEFLKEKQRILDQP
jgi:hypothetical protein